MPLSDAETPAQRRFRRTSALFASLVDLPPAERETSLARLQDSAPDLAAELRALLAHDAGMRAPPEDRVRAGIESALREVVPDAFLTGRRLGAYEVVELIGGGGMGRVYRARRADGTAEHEVAIKLVRSELVLPGLLERFSRERRMLAALDHPGICRFVDAGRLPGGAPYVVMELMRGEPLLAFCNRRRLGIEQRLQLLQHVLAAVQHAHANLIIHRDLKSDNILVDEEGRPKLIDFGIARCLTDAGGSGITATAERFGTPASAAPELLRGEPVGVAADIYAIGTLAFELLGGTPPFDLAGLGAADIERCLLHIAPPAMSRRAAQAGDEVAQQRGLSSADALGKRLQGDLDAIIAACLRKRPSDRYAGAEALSDDLQRVLEHRPISMRRTERWNRLRLFVRRHRLACALSAALLLAIASAAGVVIAQAFDLAEQRNRVVAERDRAQQMVLLLQQAFAASNPAGAGGQGLRATDVVDVVRRSLDRFHHGQPQLYAALATTIAAIDLDLGRFQSAVELTRRAIDAAKRAGDDTALRDLSLLDARIATASGDFSRAEQGLRAVAELDDGPRADSLVALANLRLVQARRPEAIALLQMALAQLRAVPGAATADSIDLRLRALSYLSAAWRLEGSPRQALQVLDDSIAAQEQLLGRGHPRTTLDLLARVNLMREIAPAGADQRLASMQDLLATIEQQFGPDSAVASRAQASLGFTLQELGRDAEAVAAFERSHAVLREVNGSDHVYTLLVGSYLAEALGASRADDVRSEALFTAALAGLTGRIEPDGSSMVRVRSGFAEFLAARQRVGEALDVLAAAELAPRSAMPAESREQIRRTTSELLATPACSDTAGAPRCVRLARLLAAVDPPGSAPAQ